jgi:hypothetical protein
MSRLNQSDTVKIIDSRNWQYGLIGTVVRQVGSIYWVQTDTGIVRYEASQLTNKWIVSRSRRMVDLKT